MNILMQLFFMKGTKPSCLSKQVLTIDTMKGVVLINILICLISYLKIIVTAINRDLSLI